MNETFMPKASALTIISPAQLLDLQKLKQVSERQHWSFAQGEDSYDVITLTDGRMLGVVADPEQLGREAREEIAAVIESERARRAEVNPQLHSAPEPTPAPELTPASTPLTDAQ